MSATVVCPGCGRRVRMESGVALRRAKCSKCRARLYRPRPDRLRARLNPDTAADPHTLSDAPFPVPVPPPAAPAVSATCSVEILASGGREPPGGSTQPVGAGSLPVGSRPPLARNQQVFNSASATPTVPRRRWPVAAGATFAAVALMLFGALAYRAGVRDASPPPVESVAEAPAAPPPPPAEPPTPAPPTHLDLVYRTGRSRLDDGPADVTALARTPAGEAVVGYADGSTRIWPLDQPAFDAPRPGPTADGPVRRITLDPAGRVAYLATPRGLTAAPLRAPPRHPVVIPGDPAAVFFEPDRDRFAAVRDGRVRVRYLPTGLIAAPPPARAVSGFVTTVSQDEVIPLGVPPVPPPVPAPPTFLAWHPAGRLIAGLPDGAVRTWPGAGPRSVVVSREHRAAVRAWAAAGRDFATGDDAGVVGYWPNGATFPLTFRAADAPVRHLDFGPCAGDLLVVDAEGGVAAWDPAGPRKLFELRLSGPTAAAALGPADDIVLLADGKGVEVVWLAVR